MQMCTNFIIIIIIIIIIIHIPYFRAFKLIFKTVHFSRTKQTVFTVLPNIFWLYGIY